MPDRTLIIAKHPVFPEKSIGFIRKIMNLRKHPIQNLTDKLVQHRAFSRRNFSRIAVFYAKLILQEPFRILERVNYANKLRNYRLQKDPVFIIGHWRSGTSFLQYLLSRDPLFGYMNKFQVVFPDLFLYSETFLKSLAERIPKSLNLIRDAKNMSVNLELDSPSEIEIALTCMMSPASLHWGHIFPNQAWEYFNKYLFLETASNSDIQQLEYDYHHLIKKVSLKNQGKQVLIKSPGNTSRINKLLELYPNARFIYIHRNPYDVFYSSKKLWYTLLDNLALQNMTKHQMELIIIRTYKKLIQKYLRQREQVPEGQLVELRFDDFISDPVKELSSVYEQLHLDGFTKAEPLFHQFLKNKAEATSSSYTYEERIINMVNKNWEFAFKEWDYPLMLDKKQGLTA